MRPTLRRMCRRVFVGLAYALLGVSLGVGASLAQSAQKKQPPKSPDPALSADHRPYDGKLLRLAEILGAIHYLRELCDAGEGQLWRQQMAALVQAEGTTALRRARLVRAFNKGYRGYRRTYHSCSESAVQAINLFMREGADLARTIAEENR